MIRTYQLDGGSILVTGSEQHPDETFSHSFVQGGCPLRLARHLEELAVRIRKTAYRMGATQEGGW